MDASMEPIKYLALVRGINVGGNSSVKMAELKLALEKAGLQHVHTYIQSGNVFFESGSDDGKALAAAISKAIAEEFDVAAEVVVLNERQWQRILAAAPAWWGADQNLKYNLFVLLPPYNMADVIRAIGDVNQDVETIAPGDGVLYQSLSKAILGRVTTGKLANSPIYKRLTVRNYNTARKLLELF
jgi:uncharacterized protein (DUF1697 family)